MARIQSGESPDTRYLQSRRLAKGQVRRRKADAFGTSGHVTTKSLIYSAGGDTGKSACCKSSVYARKDSCLTTGDLPCVANAKAATTEDRETDLDRVASKPAFTTKHQ